MEKRTWFINIRAMIGITQEQVAEIVNERTNSKISRSMIGHIETGEASPSVELAKNISIALEFYKYNHKWTDFFEQK